MAVLVDPEGEGQVGPAVGDVCIAGRRFHPELSRFGPLAAPVAGVAFGFGWTPCIDPVLTSVLALAATQGGVDRAAGLLAAYSAGLGLPFLATGLALGRLAGALAFVKRHSTALTATSAISLAAFGVLLALDRLVWLTARLQGWRWRRWASAA